MAYTESFSRERTLVLTPAGLVRDNAPAQVPLEEMFEDLKLDENDQDDASVPRDDRGVYLDEGDMDL